VPGPSAVIAALSASGVEARRWLFCGFLPTSAAARRAELERLGASTYPLVLYEAPHRIAATLDALLAAFGPECEVVIARELTKRFESIHRCTLGDAPAWLAADSDRSRGEFVVIVGARGQPASADAAAEHGRLLSLLLAELPLAQAVRLAASLTGAPRKALYAQALALAKR